MPGCITPLEQLGSPSQRSPSQGPAAPKLRAKGRGRAGPDSQMPASPCHSWQPQCPSAPWGLRTPPPTLLHRWEASPCLRKAGIREAGRAQLPGPVGRGLWEVSSGVPCPLGCHITTSQGNGAMGSLSPHVQASLRQKNTEPGPVWYLWSPGSQAQAPGAPADTSWDLWRGHGSQHLAGTRQVGGVVLSPGGSKRVHRAILFSWKSVWTDSFFGHIPGQ